MGTNKKRLALVGMGNQGWEHLLGQQFSEKTRFVAGVEPLLQRHSVINQSFPDIKIFSNVEQLLEQQKALNLDGIVLCLPHHSYADIWSKIVDTGLPLLKEKPLGRNLEEARFLSSSVHGGRIQTAIQRRHHTSYLKLKELLSVPDIEIYEVYAWLHLGRKLSTEKSGNDWRSDQKTAGGGILLDAGYHLVDLMHFYLGSLEMVNCELWQMDSRLMPEQIDNRAQLLLRNSRTWAFVDTRLDGDLDDNGIPQKSEGIKILTNQGEYFADRTQVCKDNDLLWFGEREWQQAMGRQLDDFANAIETDNWYASTYWDQIPAMQLIELAYQQVGRI